MFVVASRINVLLRQYKDMYSFSQVSLCLAALCCGGFVEGLSVMRERGKEKYIR